ncbi:YibE/F family protein [Latilactobacillus curvatus]|uniref:YibE/F family protein n=2 Tax=Latilactobacillus curvatus TaxID=28038 RepID=UPI000978CAE6|nr:YibE/F family protein [Latilactobacillus curvatus]MCP8847578.1 YibE/F family protein [Latilactobacillus curvatus]MCP8865039.1 YibE/F family protein [Latilactobacillus curvatus]MCP8865961.1 YibE/F family protein [Latilactobacillus curvatus]MCP8870313.1 YibE/F family protein [Latilactobacillus curvatus]MCP8873915.1 YibE/F family protein [Latilactobacillus curvatus]
MMLLTGILLILLVLVCGWQGLTIFFSLGLNFVVIILALVLVAGGFEPLIVSGLLSLILLATSIFMNTKQPLTAKTAFVTSLIVVVGLLIIIVPLSQLAATYGFGAEDAEEIEGFGLAIGLSFQKISIMMIILGSLGAIAETSIAVASGLVEILEYDAQMGSKQLFKAGIAIGEKIIATAFNTLFFSFFGSFLSLTMWFIQLGYPISKIVNHKILIGEGLALLIGVIGVIATVPLTSWLLNYFRKPKDE